jgi:hypothetical protein
MTQQDIKCWGDLPSDYRQMYLRTSLRYRSSRMYARTEDADRAAFEDVRAHYWAQSKTVRKQADDPRLIG